MAERIAILYNLGSSVNPSRKELVYDFHKAGFEVFWGAVDDGVINEYYSDEKRTARFFPINASRNNTNPMRELRSILSVSKQIRNYKIKHVLIYGVKNHAAMAIGAKMGGAKKVICIVNGRGNLFKSNGIKGKLLQTIAFPALKIAYRLSNGVLFQNHDDKEFFLKKKLISSRTKTDVTAGSGVNTNDYPCSILPVKDSFLYMARITKSKGILEYIKAAEIVKKTFPNAEFHIVGPVDNAVETDDCIQETINNAVENNIIIYHGKVDNVIDYLKECRYFVYPSYYPEGVPRCVLQALSIGRPIITTDSVGCKDTVIDGKNGYIIHLPVSIEELSAKMIELINNPGLSDAMSKESRKLSEEIFDINIVNKKIIGFFREK